MSWNDNLEGNAMQIAATDASKLRVPAGPGTGKSIALQRRVARLLQHGQDPARILVVTFTRNAASSLVEDLRSLEVDGCEHVNVGTLHSYCFSLLRTANVFNYLDRVARPLLTFPIKGSLQYEAKAMLDDPLYITGQRSKRELTKQILAFEAAWARRQEMHPGRPSTVDDKSLETHLVAWLRFHRSILIGELIPLTLRYLTDNPVDPEDSTFDHVIVDEYQDLNRAEQAIVDILATHGNTTIVGDADQSIYSFRFANPEGMDDFINRHPETFDVHLEDCRRCPTKVVAMANDLISHNHFPDLSPTIKPIPTNPLGEVHIVKWQSISEEIDGITRYVNYLVTEQQKEPTDILIISPRRELGYAIRDKLAEHSIAVDSHFSEQPIYANDAQRALAIFTLLCDNQDRVALRYWLGRNSSNSLRASYAKLRSWCEANNSSPWDALDAVQRGTVSIAGIQPLMTPYQELLNEIEWSQGRELSKLVDRHIPADNDELSLLRDIALAALNECTDTAEFLDYLRAHIAYPEKNEEGGVRIMSPQKAKGLTSKTVILTTCIDGILPYVDSAGTEAERHASLEEQRRLFYVAITRCTEALVISSIDAVDVGFAKQNRIDLPPGSGWVARVPASRFIGELGSNAPNTLRGRRWQQQGYL